MPTIPRTSVLIGQPLLYSLVAQESSRRPLQRAELGTALIRTPSAVSCRGMAASSVGLARGQQVGRSFPSRDLLTSPTSDRSPGIHLSVLMFCRSLSCTFLTAPTLIHSSKLRLVFAKP